MFRSILTFSCLLAFQSLFIVSLNAQVYFPCDCISSGNCPVPINDNSTTDVSLFVVLPSSNDLGDCSLSQVCFTIQHTWIGDLSVSLVSPSGRNYLLMADVSNDFGGCGTDDNNMDVCITTGQFSPLSNNTEYHCNNGPCQFGNCCLTGNWTVPCGGVTDPVNGALQAPNCDLDNFNVTGEPVNGEWILKIADICNLDEGTLHNFSLQFVCDPGVSNSCLANGGLLLTDDVSACQGDLSLLLDIEQEYCFVNPPADTSHEYGFFVVQNDTIISLSAEPDLTSFSPGTYLVYGFSYESSFSAEANALVNGPLQTALDLFQPGTEPFCGNFSGDFVTVNIYADPGSIACQDIMIDAGPDRMLVCDSTDILTGSSNIPGSTSCVNFTWKNQAGEILDLVGNMAIQVDEPGLYTFSYFNATINCLVSDTVLVSAPNSPVVDAGEDIVLTCWSGGYWLGGSVTGSGNTLNQYWTDENGMVLSDSLAVQVAVSGTYILHGIDLLNGCEDTDSRLPSQILSFKMPILPLLAVIFLMGLLPLKLIQLPLMLHSAGALEQIHRA